MTEKVKKAKESFLKDVKGIPEYIRMWFGEINIAQLLKQLIPYLIVMYFVDKAAFVYRHIKGPWLTRILKTMEIYGEAFKYPAPSLYYSDISGMRHRQVSRTLKH